MKDRILRILQEKQLTSAKLADLIMVQRSSISHILSGRNKPSMDFLEKILVSFPDISGDWLITGQGDMNKAGYSSSESTKVAEVRSSSSYPTDLFESTPPKKNSNVHTHSGIYLAQQPPISKEIEVGYKPGKIVKRVVIYYDDNSYDELFLNK